MRLHRAPATAAPADVRERLSQFILYAVLAGSALGSLSEIGGEVAQASGTAERLFEIFAICPAIAAGRELGYHNSLDTLLLIRVQHLEGAIRCKHIDITLGVGRRRVPPVALKPRPVPHRLTDINKIGGHSFLLNSLPPGARLMAEDLFSNGRLKPFFRGLTLL
jgi:hypothetical protein